MSAIVWNCLVFIFRANQRFSSFHLEKAKSQPSPADPYLASRSHPLWIIGISELNTLQPSSWETEEPVSEICGSESTFLILWAIQPGSSFSTRHRSGLHTLVLSIAENSGVPQEQRSCFLKRNPTDLQLEVTGDIILSVITDNSNCMQPSLLGPIFPLIIVLLAGSIRAFRKPNSAGLGNDKCVISYNKMKS